jgi:hypothetical protein
MAEEAPVFELLVALTVEDFDKTPWGHRNARLKAPDRLQLTLFTDRKK